MISLGGIVAARSVRVGGDEFDPVSYTHLDVYKRQALISRRAMMASAR